MDFVPVLSNGSEDDREKFDFWISAPAASFVINSRVALHSAATMTLTSQIVKAAMPVIEKFGCAIIAQSSDIPCFLKLCFSENSCDKEGDAADVMNETFIKNEAPTKNEALLSASLVIAAGNNSGLSDSENNDVVNRESLECTGDDAKHLAACYLADFQTAAVLYMKTMDEIRRILILVPSNEDPTKISGVAELSCTVMRKLLENGHTIFSVGCEK